MEPRAFPCQAVLMMGDERCAKASMVVVESITVIGTLTINGRLGGRYPSRTSRSLLFTGILQASHALPHQSVPSFFLLHIISCFFPYQNVTTCSTPYRRALAERTCVQAHSSQSCMVPAYLVYSCSNISGLSVRPPGYVCLKSNRPPGMCRASAFYGTPRSLFEEPATFLANPSVDELLAVISTLATAESQEDDDFLSSCGSAVTDLISRFQSSRRVKRVPVSSGQA
jgi:hypothetical protein